MNIADECLTLATKLYHAPRPEGQGSESWDKWDDAREIEKMAVKIQTIAEYAYCDGVRDMLKCVLP